MPLRVAIANGNWSNPAIWNGGVLPSAGDIVASNAYTVTIDQNVTVDTITNASRSITTAVPLMTGNTSPSGIASGSFTNAGLSSYWQFFDGNQSINAFSGNVVSGDFVSYEFTSPKAIDMFSITFATAYSTSVSIQGWNGSSWINIQTVSIVSTTVYTSSILGNSTPYIKYRILFNTSMTLQVREIYFYEYLGTSNATVGGSFILNTGITVNANGGGYLIGTSSMITYSATSGSSTLIGNITNGSGGSTYIILFTGTATLNIIGDLILNGCSGVNVSSTGTLNITGNISVRGSTKTGINLVSGSILNITGDVSNFNVSGNSTNCIIASSSTINITGSVYCTAATNNVNASNVINLTNNCTLNITGSVYNDTTLNAVTSLSYVVVSTGSLSYIKHIGSMIAGTWNAAIGNPTTNGVNIFSGPFVSSANGMMPFYVLRAFLQNTLNNYFEFRDSSTNGVISPPGAAAPIKRLVSPDTIIDIPSTSNVRNGVTYALGSQTGTLKVPLPSQVSKGIETDNTVGTAALTPEDVWNALTSSMTIPGSIGNRLKNTSTVETTGDQIASLL